MRTTLLIAGAAASLTAGAAFSLQAIQNVSGPVPALNVQPASGLASLAPVRQVHTVPVERPEAMPETIVAEAEAPKSASTDFYDVQPARSEQVPDPVKSAALNNVAEPVSAAVAPPASIAPSAENSPNRPSVLSEPRHRKTMRAVKIKPAVQQRAPKISARHMNAHRARVSAQAAAAPAQASDPDEIHNPLSTITELLQKGF